MTELKPCPFCGGEARLHGKFDYDPLPDEILSILRFSTPTILEANKWQNLNPPPSEIIPFFYRFCGTYILK